jgi:hypothetical protein
VGTARGQVAVERMEALNDRDRVVLSIDSTGMMATRLQMAGGRQHALAAGAATASQLAVPLASN